MDLVSPSRSHPPNRTSEALLPGASVWGVDVLTIKLSVYSVRPCVRVSVFFLPACLPAPTVCLFVRLFVCLSFRPSVSLQLPCFYVIMQDFVLVLFNYN